ncbi:peptidase M20 [Caldithrix abyssi DSM 13497]|uniref:Acetylornithine deacetylase n=1 Tax=Caldithrix abyssi DSM 13497 TaxID=880073 RepID=H1XRZ4_CALAY|nr:M20 family metallo-hydrolase [Caldithrix abyssi]APF18485.1 acetylornithine deacetylase [Caldithrix abyssi DSM 13497]EHO42487.1 peptidase M20 [Caldithrix abyssi DSM 13497]
MQNIQQLTNEAIELLKQLIKRPSFSGQEDETAALIEAFLQEKGVATSRKHNNVWALNKNFDPTKPTLLLNSHHDTVRSVQGWQTDPFEPVVNDGKLIGLGSNDAGGPLVSLLAVFVYFYEKENLSYNVIMAATAEEENSGEKGIRSVLPEWGAIDLAIVGEPTGMQMATAEKGLMVLRCRAHGVAGHAARNLGENAILKAMKDIEWFSTFQFPRVSKLLGPVKMTVTTIQAGELHNVIPDRCDFTVDIRTTEVYTHEEILDLIRQNIESEIVRTSLRLKPSSIDAGHELVKIAEKMGISTFGSPTLSDQTYIEAPSVKMGPGMSERSHTPNEFIYLREIEDGIRKYVQLLERLLGGG